MGFGTAADLERTEDRGAMEGADPSVLSERAIKRGQNQLGTLGSGNHFLEIEVVDAGHGAGLAPKVARLRPLGVIKG